MSNFISVFTFFLFVSQYAVSQNELEAEISTYLGNEKRNYYGNKAPEKLDTLWMLYLGEGISPAYGNPDKVWKGAGWTGQPLYIREKEGDFLIQPSFDYNLKKINALTGEIVWEYRFDDILKGTPTFWENENENNPEKRYVILQGSRRGRFAKIDDKYIPSFRGISYMTGKELWRINIKKTDSYSRDTDGSAIVKDDTAYLAFENGLFTAFSPDPNLQERREGMKQAKIFYEIRYYNDEDIELHGSDLVAESSPAILDDVIYTASGSGHIYGHSIASGETVWDFYTGTDMNGSAAVTDDSCIIVAVEKQYTEGPGGVLKLKPKRKGSEAVEWYFPVPNKKWYHWDGGIIGSVAINDAYSSHDSLKLAAFIDVSGYLYVVKHRERDGNRKALGPDGKTWYPTPELLIKHKLEGTIATPIIVEDKLVAPTDNGLFLYRIDIENEKLILLDSVPNLEIDATPIAVDGRIYIAVRNGYLYCFGEKE